jgi:hypothetical protein
MEPNHKEILISLLGSTYGELKRLDDSIVGSSKFLTSRRDELKHEIESIVKGAPASKPDVPILQAIEPTLQANHHVPAPTVQTFVPPPQPVQIQQPVQQQILSDPNQLELPLDKATRYEDIINSIDKLYEKMNKLEDKMDLVLKNLNAPKKKAPGLNQS